MSGRRASASIVANPVLVGAVTTLVVVVAVFLAYNANNGLPFVPTKQYQVEFPNGANLVTGNEVREGGFRVGVVEDMVPSRLSDGSTGAVLKVKLDQTAGLLPTDTGFVIRPRSSLGLKYLDIQRGKSSRTLPDGSTFKIGKSTVPVELDEFYNMFDEPTRKGATQSLQGFGDTFAFRGPDLNRVIEDLPEFLGDLEPVMRNLRDEDTQLKNFFPSLQRVASEIAPVAEVNAQLFSDMATTFEALTRDEESFKDFISKQPDTLAVGERSLRAQRPFLADTADFSHSLRLAAHELRLGLPNLNAALKVGVPVLERSVQTSEDLGEAMEALYNLTSAPTSTLALRGLTQTVSTLNPVIKFIGPYQTVCNFWNWFWTLAAEHLTEDDYFGHAQRALINTTSQQANSLGSIGATEPANGQGLAPGVPPLEGNAQYMHGQVYGAAINEDGTADCENGQRGFMNRLVHFDGEKKYNAVIDPHTPGSQGSTFAGTDDRDKPLTQRALGRDRVPKGQTFSRRPLTGPALDPALEEGRYGGAGPK